MGGIVSSVLDVFTGADETREAAAQASAQQAAAAREAAQLALFKPVGMTTRFGSSAFQYDPTGKISGAQYQLSPELTALQNYLTTATGQSLTDVERLRRLGQSYISESPEAAARKYVAEQQGLLAPGRERELASTLNKEFQTGRTGLATGGTTTGYTAGSPGLAQSNPMFAALANARAAQDAQIAAQAQTQAQQQIGFGQGLLSSAYSPLQTGLGMLSAVEEVGQQPFKLSLQTAGLAAPSQGTAAGLLNQGLSSAAQTQYQGVQAANAANSQFLSSAIGAAAGGFGGGGGMLGGLGSGAAGGYGMGALGYGMGYGINPFSQQAKMLAAQW